MRILTLLLLCVANAALAQTRPIDVLHYRFELTLSDTTDVIKGHAFITAKILQDANDVTFDIQTRDKEGKGMVVYEALDSGLNVSAVFDNNKVVLHLSKPCRKGETRTFEIFYKGIPKDGLIISRNKFGERTFFGDNWPDRAKHWLPCIDDPADKAQVEFVVTAPLHYQVVSNGVQVEETVLANNMKLTHWRENVPLATKIMVIGVADFAVQYVGDTLGVQVYSWVYTKDRDKAFYDYALAKQILPFFNDYVAPFPYKKLANVQSTTIFGGMENAGCIFYAEGIITGTRKSEDLLTHEIAHQWFGDMVTETSFAHLWLSEGFATYFTDMYLEKKYGLDSMNKRLQNERTQVINFNRRNPKPVVDTATKNYMQLLNANSYQKGAWVLHMLRNEMGDAAFREGIRSYYNAFAGGNANTERLLQAMQDMVRKDIKPFFNQWLYTAGHPVLKVTHAHNASDNTLSITIAQQQSIPFTFPLEVEVQTAKGNVRQTLQVSRKEETFTIKNVGAPSAVVLDPGTKLLFEKVQ